MDDPFNGQHLAVEEALPVRVAYVHRYKQSQALT